MVATPKHINEARRLAKTMWTARPDFTGGIRYVKSERHVGYLAFDAYAKQMNRLRRRMGWPHIAPGHYVSALQQPVRSDHMLDQHPRALARQISGSGSSDSGRGHVY